MLRPDGTVSYDAFSSSIEIIGAWDKSELSVLLIPHSDDRLNKWVMEGAKWWDRATEVFTALHGYEYLEKLRFSFYVYGVNGTSGDITIRFVSNLGDNVCGRATVYHGAGLVITSASISISLSCIGTNEEYAKVVSAHELGHALGLGHTDNCADVMCRHYIVIGARPSTLDFYGLAVAYSWLRSGIFVSPPSLASLPSNIPFVRLLDEKGMPIILRVKLYRRIDGSTLELLRTFNVKPGEVLNLRAEKFIEVSELERLRFVGWSSSSGFLSSSETLSYKPLEHVTLIQDYVTQYWVSFYKEVEPPLQGWFDKGIPLMVDVPQFVEVGEGTRLRFDGWVGDVNSTENPLKVTVTRPLNVTAKWVKQYLIKVISEYGTVRGAGWYDKGSEASIEVEPRIIDFGNSTRLYMQGFKGDVKSASSRVVITVNSPKTLIAKWVTQLLIRVYSTHGEKLLSESWVTKGESVILSPPSSYEWPNMTRAFFERWGGDVDSTNLPLEVRVNRPLVLKALYSIEYFVSVYSPIGGVSGGGWYKRGEKANLSAKPLFYFSEGGRAKFVSWSGDISSDSPKLSFKVSKPFSLVANWLVEYALSVDYPKPLQDLFVWVKNGSLYELSAKEVVMLSKSRRMVFERWEGDLSSSNNSISVSMSSPVKLKAVYVKEVLTTLIENPAVKERHVVFELLGPQGKRIKVSGGSQLWLSEGVWSVEKAEWLGVDVLKDEHIVPIEGETIVNVRLRYVSVTVNDLIGLPTPFVKVLIARQGGFVESSGTTDYTGRVLIGPASPAAGLLIVDYAFISFNQTFSPKALSVTAEVPLGVYSLLLFSVAIVAFYFSLKHRRRRRPKFTLPPL